MENDIERSQYAKYIRARKDLREVLTSLNVSPQEIRVIEAMYRGKLIDPRALEVFNALVMRKIAAYVKGSPDMFVGSESSDISSPFDALRTAAVNAQNKLDTAYGLREKQEHVVSKLEQTSAAIEAAVHKLFAEQQLEPEKRHVPILARGRAHKEEPLRDRSEDSHGPEIDQ